MVRYNWENAKYPKGYDSGFTPAERSQIKMLKDVLGDNQIKIPAKIQKAIFGYAPFGRKDVEIQGKMIIVSIQTAFGHDRATEEVSNRDLFNYVDQKSHIEL